ncbi:hypothetical protein Tco_0849436, partial [Tanacetum coccineum]
MAFERLGNRVRGWTQKALVGTFMAGLKPEIEDGIRMFKPTNFKDATILARVRDDQLNRLSPITQASSAGPTKNTTMKRLTWDKMQKKRDQDGIAEIKIDFADKFQLLEDIMTILSDAILSGKGGDNYKQAGRLMFYSKLTKLEFPIYH